jgi:hypothetical protein
MSRKEGYYWVKFKGQWEVANWNSSYSIWKTAGCNYYFRDDEFDEINETQILLPNN